MKNKTIKAKFSFFSIMIIISLSIILILTLKLYNLDTEHNNAQKNKHGLIKVITGFEDIHAVLAYYSLSYVETGDTAIWNEYNNLLNTYEGRATDENNKMLRYTDNFDSYQINSNELKKIQELKQIFQEIRIIENEAINAKNGIFNDGFGSFTRFGKSDKDKAISFLYGEVYSIQNDKFYAIIDDLIQLIDNRYNNDIEKISKTAQYHRNLIIIIIFICLVFIFLIRFSITRDILRPINQLHQLAKQFALGQFSSKVDLKVYNEIGKLSQQFIEMANGLELKSKFVQNIGAGRFDIDYSPLSEMDEMGKSLIEMRGNLQKSKAEEEKRKLEDIERSWAAEGIAMFSDILRKDNDNIKKLADNININIVKYLNANQGGLFLINDKDKGDIFIEMISAFAYNRLRNEKNRFELGEGLIGRCIDERESIYMTDIPQEYLNITSGLGGASPKYLLIVPLMLNEEIYGVMELASFYELKPFQITFVEKIAESIASTISSAKINAQTAELLSLAQENAEEMAAQEEEMRQNFEELEATQDALDAKDKQQQRIIEELNRENEEKINEMLAVQEKMEAKEAEIQSVLRAIDSSSLSAEYDLDGKILKANERFTNALKIPDTKSMKHSDMYQMAINEPDEYNRFWNALRNGITRRIVQKANYIDTSIWLSETYTPIFDKAGNPYKVFCISDNIDSIKLQEQKMEDLLKKQKKQANKLQEQEIQLLNTIEEMRSTQEAMGKRDDEQREKIETLEKENEMLKLQTADLKELFEKQIAELKEEHKQFISSLIENSKK